MALLGVGLDIADVSRFAALLVRGGGQFKHRWFTDDEIRECDAQADPTFAYAARFAAKEAVWKALRQPGNGAVPWKSISVLTEGRQPRVHLAGALADAAAAVGFAAISVTMTRAGAMATAFAVAEGADSAGVSSTSRGVADDG